MGENVEMTMSHATFRWEYPINRFAMETKRQLDVLDRRLEDNRVLAGEEFSIADMAVWPWCECMQFAIEIIHLK